MRLVKQICLVFQRGRSEKVFEIDLCEVGPGKYVVNYRYGRRGAALKDGSKTVAPVGEAEAGKIYDKLVGQKQQQGYAEGESYAAAPPPPVSAPSSQSPGVSPPSVRPPETAFSRPSRPPSDPRQRAVLARLERGGRPQVRPSLTARVRQQFSRRRSRSVDKQWSLDRAIWRAGEMGIRTATPLLARLVGTGETLRDYCIAWSIGRCGDPSGLAALRGLYQSPGSSPAVVRITTAAMLELLAPAERDEFARALVGSLPEPLRTDDPQALSTALDAHLTTDDEPYGASEAGPWAALETLYLSNTPAARHAVTRVLRTAPLRPPAFQRFRAIFKLAEFRRDGLVFGILAHRFATERAMFEIKKSGTARVPDRSGQRTTRMRPKQLRAMLAGPRPSAAYSSKTRAYFRRRVWHTLRRLAELEDTDYVPMAVGVLIAFTDDDGQSPRRGDRNIDGRWQAVHEDRFARYWAFNHILYLNSPRYARNQQVWLTKGRYAPGDPSPRTREEAFPHLWDQRPQGLLQLLDGSECDEVHVFAVRAIGEQRDFCAALPVEAVTMILSRSYEVTVRFGFALAQQRFRPGVSAADLSALALAVSTCGVSDVRREGHRWIESSPSTFLADGPFLAGLIACPFRDTRTFAIDFLRRSPALADDVARALVGGLVARLLATGEGDDVLASDLASVLEDVFGPRLVGLGEAVVTDLAQHPLAPVQTFVGRLMLARAASIAPKALTALLESTHAEARVLALRVFGLLDDAALLEGEALLWSSTVHRDQQIRDAIRPIVCGLAQRDPAFGDRCLQMLIASLLRRRLPEGVPGHVVRVLREDLGALLPSVPAEIVWRLLRSKEGAAQELGGVLLPSHPAPETVELAQIVELASHEVLSVRQAAWTLMERMVPRLQREIEAIIGVLDADWEDSRIFAFEFFETHFAKEHFSPALLVSICDSVRPDVQRFGRNLITRHFDEAHGDQYLLQLSEHPSSDVQLFASNFLERYASGSAEKLEQLAPYFIRVLCGINRGRVVRLRAQSFLRSQALADEGCARVVARVLERQSATAAVEDRAAAIETMVAIAHTWPDVPLPIEIEAPALRAGAN